ncbi:MAG: chloride channel protein [Desulfobacterales bacterium]
MVEGRSAPKGSSAPDLARAGRWAFFVAAIGLIAGAAAIVFYFLCQAGTRFLLDALAGLRPPPATGEAALFPQGAGEFSRWVLLVLPAAGGLVSGLLVDRFCPAAAGGGNDAAIRAYHESDGRIPPCVPLVKSLATAILIPSGGSGGREGPIAQIGAGLGSLLASRLGLTPRERRILTAAGIAAGIGSIFRAPLAGALFAAEFLYRDPEFEFEVIIPGGMASIVAYCLFCSLYGWEPLLAVPGFSFRNPLELGPYFILALFVAGAAVVFVRGYRGISAGFRRLKVPAGFKPALGGLATGLIGFFLPHTLSFGYGYAELAIAGALPLSMLVSLAAGKMLTTSFSIGSGGSGGLFGPSLVIGAALGGIAGELFHQWIPAVVSSPGAFALVGMAGFVAAVANTPISIILFVSEMTGSYRLLIPCLLVCSIAYLATRRYSLFPAQVRRRLDSPAHAGELVVDVLQAIRVRDLLERVRPVEVIPEEMRLVDFKALFARTDQHYFPVRGEGGKLKGIFSINDVRSVLFSPEVEPLVVMKDIATYDIIAITPDEDLSTVLRKFTIKNIDSLPVVSEEDPGVLIGMLSRRDVIDCYNRRIKEWKSAREGTAAGADRS